MPKFDTSIRSMSIDELIDERNSLYMNNEDWAMKRFIAVCDELERRDIILDNQGNIIYGKDKVDEAPKC